MVVPPDASPAPPSCRIAILDDDPNQVRLMTYHLKALGYKTDAYLDPRKFLEEFPHQQPYDLLILDIMMPDISGLEVCKRLREKYSPFELPILIISALNEAQQVADGLATGANDYVTKPVGRIELQARVKSLISLKRVYELAKANERLATYRALYDDLTGLPNRSYLSRHLQERLLEAEREGYSVALFFLNVNRFKSINNSLGYAAGDIYLKALSEKLYAALHPELLVVRLHADTFAMVKVFPDQKARVKAEAERIAETILDFLQKGVSVQEQEVQLPFSMGISLFPHDANSLDELYRHADTALSYAKESPSGTILFFAAEMHDRAAQRFQLERNLQKALANQEFALQYQPQWDFRKNVVVGMEALIRWHHPEEGLISPGSFIPMAEEVGTIVPIGDWVFKEVCRQAKTWLDQGLHVPKISINLSPRQFHKKNLLNFIERVLSDTSLDPNYLELEITEGTLMSNVLETVKVLNALNDMGLRISVDDFGTGYSSLTYLKRFPVHTLKIDQSFIRDVNTSEQDAAIVASIITLGQSLGLNLIAEGVENEQQLEFLKRTSCSVIQGNYFSHPREPNEVVELLKGLSG